MKQIKLALCLLLIIVLFPHTSQATFTSAKFDNFQLHQLKKDENKVIITLKNGTSKRLPPLVNEKITQLKNIPVITSSLSQNQIKDLAMNPNVLTIEKDVKVKLIEPKESPIQAPMLSTQEQDWGIDTVKAPLAWSKNITGKNVKVAVIDTGVGSHKDIAVRGGVSFVPYTKSYNDDNGHGTHVAGIISAENNDFGVVGVAPDSQIYAVKVLDKNGYGDESDVIKGIDWAITNKMDIINMSLGSPTPNSALEKVCNKAYSKGLLIVGASGNEGNYDGVGESMAYPAKYSSVIAVGATDEFGLRAWFSSTGKKVEISAPGDGIYSTYLNNTYEYLSGTSMATPYVAGVLALYKEAYPTLTIVQLRKKVDQNTIDLGLKGRDIKFGFGQVLAPNLTGKPFDIPKKTKLFTSFSSKLIKSRDLTILTIKATDDSSKPLLYREVLIVIEFPNHTAKAIYMRTNSKGIARKSFQNKNTSLRGLYSASVEFGIEGYIGSFNIVTFQVK